MTYEEALQIAKEELDEKIEYLSDTFKGHSARIESYIYDLSMARKALMQELKDAEEKPVWIPLKITERNRIIDEWQQLTKSVKDTEFKQAIRLCKMLEEKLRELNV